MSNKIISSGGFVPSSIDTPLDLRTRVQSVDDIYNIDLPYVGMIVYVIDEDKYYKIKTLKAKEVGVASVENVAVDTFEEFLTQGPQGPRGLQGLQGKQGPQGEIGPQGPAGKDADVSNLLTSENPSAIGTFSLNRKSDSTIGSYSSTLGYDCISSKSYSHAEGKATTASGSASHAEGDGTIAYSARSHAEGYNTSASGLASHAEGGHTKTSKDYSHAEGYYSKAYGIYSHAENYNTEAHGSCSHAEGAYTYASGARSHVEGYYTTANGANQHVQGRYNIEDTEEKYAHIVGNGAEGDLSNAHTLDWDGNAWFAGDVSIGTENKKLATEDMVIALQQEIAELRALIEELKNK